MGSHANHGLILLSDLSKTALFDIWTRLIVYIKLNMLFEHVLSHRIFLSSLQAHPVGFTFGFHGICIFWKNQTDTQIRGNACTSKFKVSNHMFFGVLSSFHMLHVRYTYCMYVYGQCGTGIYIPAILP